MNVAKTMSGAMEGGGAYNRHASLQAAGGTLALDALRQAASSAVLETADQPIVIAEYGVSQGRNSQLPMRIAITALRARVGSHRPVLVYHEDLPANDFGSLFEVLESAPDRYARDDPHRVPLCNRPVVLRERAATGVRASRMERVRRDVVKPRPYAGR
jgi:hypothetical protein